MASIYKDSFDITASYCTKYIFNGKEVTFKLFFRKIRRYLKKRSVRKKEIYLELQNYRTRSSSLDGKNNINKITIVFEVTTKVNDIRQVVKKVVKDVEIKIEANENGDFKIVGEYNDVELMMFCSGLIKFTAEYLGKTEVELLEIMLKVEKSRKA